MVLWFYGSLVPFFGWRSDGGCVGRGKGSVAGWLRLEGKDVFGAGVLRVTGFWWEGEMSLTGKGLVI